MKVKTYLITGANRGIGKGLVEEFMKQNDPMKSIILASRCKDKGEKAYQEIISKYSDSQTKLEHIKLDIENLTDVRLAQNYIQNKYGYLNVLINNAGYLNRNPGKSPNERVEDIIKTFSINFFSQVLLTSSLLSLIKASTKYDQSRSQIMFVSSLVGKKSFKDENLSKEFDNANLVKLEQLYNRYIEDTRSGNFDKWDYQWVKDFHCYGPSKTFLNFYMKDLSQQLLQDKIMVNTFNPGWVKTDMGGSKAPLTVEQGCRTALFLDSLTEFKTGEVYENRRVVGF